MGVTRRTLVAAAIASSVAIPRARAATKVRLGQATTSVSFLPIWAARALDTLGAEGLAMEWAAIPGGDPATLAALDAGDLDLAAVGSDTALAAIVKGQPFVLVSSLMSKMSLELVASNALMQRTGTTPASPLAQRMAALKGAIVGVSAVGGTQDRAVRWLAGQGRLDPKSDVQVALVGGPPAIQAALQNGRIDAFMLSPPEGQIAAAAGAGKPFILPAVDVPAMARLATLVLVARVPPDAATRALITSTLRATIAADRMTVTDPDRVGTAIAQKFFPKADPVLIREAVRAMVDGVADLGRLSPADLDLLRRFSRESGGAAPADDGFWTPVFLDAAMGAKP